MDHTSGTAGADSPPAELGLGCIICHIPILVGDHGLMRPVLRTDAHGHLTGSTAPVHRECEALGIVGHQHGICHCTGYPTCGPGARDAALLLWIRMREASR